MNTENILKTIIWASTPFVEMRASIPLGYLHYNLTIFEATFFSLLSIIITTILLTLAVPPCIQFIKQKNRWARLILEKILEKTRTKHSKRMHILGDILLILFVAIPLPGSGAWSGVLIAYVFGISKKKSIFLISFGLIISGIIIASLSFGGFYLWNRLF